MNQINYFFTDHLKLSMTNQAQNKKEKRKGRLTVQLSSELLFDRVSIHKNKLKELDHHKYLLPLHGNSEESFVLHSPGYQVVSLAFERRSLHIVRVFAELYFC